MVMTALSRCDPRRWLRKLASLASVPPLHVFLVFLLLFWASLAASCSFLFFSAAFFTFSAFCTSSTACLNVETNSRNTRNTACAGSSASLDPPLDPPLPPEML